MGFNGIYLPSRYVEISIEHGPAYGLEPGSVTNATNLKQQ